MGPTVVFNPIKPGMLQRPAAGLFFAVYRPLGQGFYCSDRSYSSVTLFRPLLFARSSIPVFYVMGSEAFFLLCLGGLLPILVALLG
jgi:hypothetical protein